MTKYLFLISVLMVSACGPIIIPTKSTEIGPAQTPQQSTAQQSALANCKKNLTNYGGNCAAPDGSPVEIESGDNAGTVTVS